MDQSRPQFLHRFDDPPAKRARIYRAGGRTQCGAWPAVELHALLLSKHSVAKLWSPAQPLGASAPPDRGRWLSACRRRSQPLSPTASPQSILRYEPGACPPSGEPVTPHFPASPHMPPNTASHGAPAPAGSTIDLLADRSRKLPRIDPTGRELLISCGAALFGLREQGPGPVQEVVWSTSWALGSGTTGTPNGPRPTSSRSPRVPLPDGSRRHHRAPRRDQLPGVDRARQRRCCHLARQGAGTARRARRTCAARGHRRLHARLQT
jgi:hypothetical protein